MHILQVAKCCESYRYTTRSDLDQNVKLANYIYFQRKIDCGEQKSDCVCANGLLTMSMQEENWGLTSNNWDRYGMWERENAFQSCSWARLVAWLVLTQKWHLQWKGSLASDKIQESTGLVSRSKVLLSWTSRLVCNDQGPDIEKKYFRSSLL